MALAALLAASATVVTLDFRSNPGGPIRRVQDAAVSVVAPLQDGIARVFKPVGDFLSGIGQIGSLREENERLRQRVESLEATQRRVPELLRENERLLKLVEAKDWSSGKKVGARAIGVGPSNYEWTVFIDKGEREGIGEGMSVVSSEGLVGRVVLAARDYAKVLLIIDPEHSVGSRLTASGETGVISGRGEEDLRFEFIDPEINVKKGETVVTSGYDKGIFPPGIPIGRVTSVIRAPSGLEKTAYVRPFVAFSRLDHLVVLLDSGPVAHPGT